MKQLMIIPTLAVCLFATTPSYAEGVDHVFDAPNDSSEVKACEAPLAVVARGTTTAYQYNYDMKEFKKIYQEAIRQAQASGQPVPSADQVRIEIENYSNKKLQKEFPGGAVASWVIELRCHFQPRLECTLIIKF